MLNLLKLSRGMMRVFIVSATIIFPLTLWLVWGGVTTAEEHNESMTNGLNITAITTGYLLLHGGKETMVNTEPTNTTMSTGWATYYCLIDGGRTYFVDAYNTANTNLSSKEFLTITNTDHFKECMTNKLFDEKIQVIKAQAFALILAITSILALYMLLLIIPLIITWVAAGFKK